MIGDSSVGKTSLVLRYDKRGFNLRFTTTIGVDYSDRLLELDGHQVKLQVRKMFEAFRRRELYASVRRLRNPRVVLCTKQRFNPFNLALSLSASRGGRVVSFVTGPSRSLLDRKK